MVASIACGVHCIAGSLVAASAGVLSVFANEDVELGFVIFAVALASVSIGLGVRRHKTLWPLAYLTMGIALLGLARTIELEELALSVAGALLLALAHGANLHALRRCC